MIVKVSYSKSSNKIYITSKPSHSGRDRQHAIDFRQTTTPQMLAKMQGKPVVYFHAHLKEDTLVLDDIIDDQRW